MNPFDDGVDLKPIGDGWLRGRTVPEWANMVGPFGGVTAATLVRAIESQPAVHGQPVALTVNYLAPISDGDFDIQTRVVRTNRSNQHWIVELRQGNEVKTTATAVFGLRRDTWSDTEITPPPVPSPQEVERSDSPFGVPWFDNYEMRFVTGAIPVMDDGGGAPQSSISSTTTLWVRDSPPRPMDFASLTALCDIFYPRAFLRRGQYLPAGTVSMTVYFHATGEELVAQGDDFVLGTARAQRFSGGYFDQTAHLWSRGGSLLASSHQFVYFKG